jgi:hypothetical protein
MSRMIITDLVLPIVMRELNKKGANIPSYAEVQDNQLIEYLESELMVHFSICGSKDHCKDLESAIKEVLQRDRESFTEYIKFLLNKYINLKIMMAGMQKIDPKKITTEQAIKMVIGERGNGMTTPEWRTFGDAPPDRFSEFHRRNKRNPLERWIPEDGQQ